MGGKRIVVRRVRRRSVNALTLLAAVWLAARGNAATNFAGGVLAGNTSWSNAVVVVSTVSIPSGVTLTILPGTQVRMTNGVSITAQSGAVLDVQGSAANQVVFSPYAGTNAWGGIAASGAGSSVTLRHAEVSFGNMVFSGGATALIEDCYIHDSVSAVVGNAAASVTLRRVHINNYFETIYNSTLILVEDCLFENLPAAGSDGIELGDAPPGCVIRRCTLRNGIGSNTDAIDCNGANGLLVQDCVIYNFSDKGFSFGAASLGGTVSAGMIVSNCLVYGVNAGAAVKDGATASFYHTTIADCATGLSLYEKLTGMGAGRCTNGWNNIVFNNTTSVNLLNGGAFATAFSDIQGTNWPGVGNISGNPIFLNAAARDYRLATNSPARGTGRNGANMGAQFPVGCFMALSQPMLMSAVKSPGVLAMSFWADGARSYTLQTSDSLSPPNWSKVTDVGTNVLPRLVIMTDSTTESNQFFRVVTPQQP